MPALGKDLLERIKHDKIDKFQAIWMNCKVHQRKNLKEAVQTWNVGYGLRFAHSWEVNILRNCGAIVHIFDVMQHDGSFAVDVSKWDEIPEEIFKYIREWSVN